MKKKVVFVTANLGQGGAQKVMATLFNHVDRTVFDPCFISFQANGPNLRYISSPESVVNLGVSRVRYGLHRLVQQIRKLNPNAVLSTLGHLNMALILARPFLPRQTKLLVREGTIPSVQLKQDTSHPRFWKWLYHNFYARADRIVCQSDYMLNDLADHFGVPREKMVRIYNPVDVDGIRQLAQADANPYLGDGPHVVSVGRLSSEKGYDLLLKAMALVHESLPHGELTILGTGPLEAALRAQRRSLGLAKVVRFVGFKPNPYPYFRHADLFVLSSRYEGFPNALLEALALGARVVATDCPGGIREILRGCLGYRLVKEGDPNLLAEGILETLTENKHCPCQVERQYHLGEFDIRHITDQYETLFQQVIDACTT